MRPIPPSLPDLSVSSSASSDRPSDRRPSLDRSAPTGPIGLSGAPELPDEVDQGDQVEPPIWAQPTTTLYAQSYVMPSPPVAQPLFQRDRWRQWLFDVLARARFAWHEPDGTPKVALRRLQERMAAVDARRRPAASWKGPLGHLIYRGDPPTTEQAFLLAQALDMSPWSFLLHGGLMTLDQMWWLAGGGSMMSRAQALSKLEASQHIPLGDPAAEPLRNADILECRRVLEFYDAIAEFEPQLQATDYGAAAVQRLETELPYGLPGYTGADPQTPLFSPATAMRDRAAVQLSETTGNDAPAFGGPLATHALLHGAEPRSIAAQRHNATAGPRYRAPRSLQDCADETGGTSDTAPDTDTDTTDSAPRDARDE